jgi:hypothetical protein
LGAVTTATSAPGASIGEPSVHFVTVDPVTVRRLGGEYGRSMIDLAGENPTE